MFALSQENTLLQMK